MGKGGGLRWPIIQYPNDYSMRIVTEIPVTPRTMLQMAITIHGMIILSLSKVSDVFISNHKVVIWL